MGQLFDVDGPVMSGLSKIADLVILNLLYIFLCVPVFTIGAATTALYYVTLKMVRNEECYTIKSFFKSFKQNFRQATIIWLIFLVAIVAILMDFRILGSGLGLATGLSVSVTKTLILMLFVACVVLSFILSYVFPVLSKFDNTVKNTIKNSFLMSIKHLPFTIAIIAINIVPFAIFYFVPSAIIFLIISFALSSFGCSFIFNKIFSIYIVEKQVTADENFTINQDEDSFLFKSKDEDDNG